MRALYNRNSVREEEELKMADGRLEKLFSVQTLDELF